MTIETSAHPAQGVIARWHFSVTGWAVLAFALFVAAVPFVGVLGSLVDVWSEQPEYSHGIVIPLISLFLIWRDRDALTRTAFKGSWAGVPLLLTGIALWYVAEFSTIWAIGQYAFLLVLYGLVLALVGSEVFRRLWMPLLVLIFMVPLPAFFSNSLSLKMQLLSSALGVGVIRLAGISVYLDGNVIDLGAYKLQVAEACSGLRYLFPLMTIAFIVAYFFRAPLWKRFALFVASIPIAILMNSLRIGLIGVTVDRWGTKMAEGLLHDFEGWVVFMICTLVLLMLAAVLTRIGRSPGRLRDVLMLDWGPSPPKAAVSKFRTLPTPFLVATVLAASAALMASTMPERVEIRPARAQFVEFPLRLDGWEGSRSPLEAVYLDQLKLDDYLLATYQRPTGLPVGVWIAYYDSQRKGQSTHSPRSCLPGGGWEFKSLTRQELQLPGARLTVNRAVIEHGSERQLMYYWFQQRGRLITNEYSVKWFIFWDAMTRNRTDGALVRLLVPLPPNASEADGDRQLTQFAGSLASQLERYVPD